MKQKVTTKLITNKKKTKKRAGVINEKAEAMLTKIKQMIRADRGVSQVSLGVAVDVVCREFDFDLR